MCCRLILAEKIDSRTNFNQELFSVAVTFAERYPTNPNPNSVLGTHNAYNSSNNNEHRDVLSDHEMPMHQNNG